MNSPLRILHLEDDPNDAEMVQAELESEGIACTVKRVDNRADFLTALERGRFDVILADYKLPSFDGLSALTLAQKKHPEAPFILISGTLGEELAIESLKAGATDYVLKNRLARLAPVVRRALSEAQVRAERRRTEQALRESEDRYRDLVENSQNLICTHDLEGRILSVNRGAATLLGYEPQALVNRSLREILAPEVRDKFDDYLTEIRQQGKAHGLMLIQTRTGEKRVWEYTNTLRVEGVIIPIVRGMAHDVTEHKRAEEAVKIARATEQAILNNFPYLAWLKDVDGRFKAVNEPFAKACGFKVNEILGKTDYDVWPEELAAKYRADDLEIMRAGTKKFVEEPIAEQSGTKWFETFKAPLFNPRGEVIGTTGIARDITERKKAEEVLRRSESRFRLIWEHSSDGMRLTDERGTILMVNKAYAQMVGKKKEELEGKPFSVVYPKEREEHIQRQHQERFNSRTVIPHSEQALTLWDGRNVWFEVSNSFFEIDGRVPMLLGIFRDISERKQAEQVLRQTEEQLRQSQKMEAIGILAGGVAHDFNNLLTAIIGYCDLMEMKLNEDDPLRSSVLEIRNAGERAATLTRQLLAFGRKQILQPKVLDLNGLVANLDKLLRRLIGEDINLVNVLDPALGRVKADPGQIEQVIMNLVVNSRDAMPHGGKLMIETANVDLDETYTRTHLNIQTGSYVMLAVSDTGCGMDVKMKAHIFEPFFTTKEQGKGTGLGLSTVYGIVKQSNGYIWVYSEPGQGATFKIYLPRIEEAAETVETPHADIGMPQGSETVLLVEDEEMVRHLTCEILRMNGYQVLEARTGSEALRISKGHKDLIHLLVTDVVMPQMSGRELADSLTRIRPATKVLYISGYTDNAVVHHGILDSGTAFLQKPFTPSDLVRKVREVLDQ